MLPVLGLSGSAIGSFKTKAEALHFAIVFTATSTENGNEFNKEKAKTLYEFITANVELPDVDYSQAQMDELFNTTNKMLLALASKLQKEENTTEAPTPPNNEDGTTNFEEPTADDVLPKIEEVLYHYTAGLPNP